MKSIKCPSGTLVKVTETDFDRAGRPVAVWAPDAISGLVVRTTPGDPVLGSGVTRTSYDANGNAIAVTSTLGNITRTAYDSRNRATKVAVNPDTGNPAHPAGAPGLNDEVTTTAYDQAGNPVSVTDARLNTSTTDYDPAGRAFRTTTPAVPVFGQSGNQPLVTENVFDKGGNITEAIDPAGYRTRNVYDAANRLIATATNPVTGNPSADPLNSPGSGDIVIRNEYDEGGNLRKVIDGLGQITRFTYDGLSRKLSTIWDADDTRAKTDQVADYDALLQISSTDALGRVTVRHYDDNDRLTGIECAAATAESRTSILDQEGQVLKILHGGHDLPDTTALTADVRHVGMAYDRLGRVTSETSAGVAHTSTWDKGGNRLTVTYGGTGRVLTSTYDKLQRLETLSEELPSETTSRLTSYAYDKNGNVTAKTHPNGTAESTSYDALNRRMVHQVTVGSTVLSSFTFSHDRQSNVAQIIETYDASAGIAGRTVTNTYDKTRRLHVETAAEPGKTVATTYGYDKANNRTSKVVATTPTGGSTTTETHGYVYGNTSNGLNSNQVWKWIKPGGAEVVYSYDANGNRATRTETIGGTPKTDTYTWDHWNRLTSLALQSKASAVNGTYSYGYDHRTRRVVRDESAIAGRTCDLVIFSGGTSVQEHEGETGATPANATTPDMEYIRGSDWGGGVGGILYTSRAGVVSWTHYNGRGDVVTRTSGTGSLTYAASYEAFGTRTQEAGTNPDRQRANTKEEDPTGLLNEGHRYRDLELGMFISRDPAGFVDGPNVYTYVVQNPWSSFDPEGLNEVIAIGGPNLTENDPLKFARAAVTETAQAKTRLKVGEQIEWVVNRQGYERRSIQDDRSDNKERNYVAEIDAQAKIAGAEIRWYNNEKEFADAVNNSAKGNKRENEEIISRFTYYGHGAPGKLSLDPSKQALKRSDLRSGLINKEAFTADAVCVSWGCNTGTPSNEGDDANKANTADRPSFADQWKASTGRPMHGAIGRTAYEPVTPRNKEQKNGVFTKGGPTLGTYGPSVPPACQKPETRGNSYWNENGPPPP